MWLRGKNFEWAWQVPKAYPHYPKHTQILAKGKLHVDFMLEELKKAPQTPELRKRVAFLARHKDRVSRAVSGELKETDRRAFSIEMAQATDDKLANALHKFFE